MGGGSGEWNHCTFFVTFIGIVWPLGGKQKQAVMQVSNYWTLYHKIKLFDAECSLKLFQREKLPVAAKDNTVRLNQNMKPYP